MSAVKEVLDIEDSDSADNAGVKEAGPDPALPKLLALEPEGPGDVGKKVVAGSTRSSVCESHYHFFDRFL